VRRPDAFFAIHLRDRPNDHTPQHSRMKHESSLYNTSGLEEWLVYSSISLKGFSITIVGENETYLGHGTQVTSGQRDLAISITGFGRKIDIGFKPEPTASRIRKFLGSTPYIGILHLDGREVGLCEVKDSHSEEEPMVRLRCKALSIALEVHRSRPNAVRCPLIISGSNYWQAVFEDYLFMSSKRQRALPQHLNPDDFVGSLRTTRHSQEPFGGELEAIGTIVAIIDLLAKPEYMKLDII
jgi:hypothetical protein